MIADMLKKGLGRIQFEKLRWMAGVECLTDQTVKWGVLVQDTLDYYDHVDNVFTCIHSLCYFVYLVITGKPNHNML